MKKKLYIIIAVAFVLLAFVGCSPNTNNNAAQSTNDTPDTSNVTANIDEKVQKVFELTNQFRTGNEAFYLNEDNTTTTSLVGKLGNLTLDGNLCKAAQIRANEIVSKFSHTRPNGTSCFTVLKDLSISYSAVGENIAAGSPNGEGTFKQWKEDNENYNGQGHRRNMLGQNFTRIGIAYTYDANSTYKYYWCMILAK